jgi:hypothetical protein
MYIYTNNSIHIKTETIDACDRMLFKRDHNTFHSQIFLVTAGVCKFWLFFILKCIKIIYFYLLKIIFNIIVLKWFENIKKY